VMILKCLNSDLPRCKREHLILKKSLSSNLEKITDLEAR
jgi:hypothetical protein